MNKLFFFSMGMSVCLLTACGGNGTENPAAQTGRDSTAKDSATAAILPDSTSFRDVVDGQSTALYVLKNKNQATAAITNYGARLVSLLVPNKNGIMTDVVLGYDSIGKYVHQPETYFGAIVGRYGNRIAKGRFRLNGKEYKLATNNGANHLHGGLKGFGANVWDAKQLNDSTLELTYLSQ